jgi:hypothetical protein
MVRIRVGGESWDIDQETAISIREYKEEMDKVMKFWREHKEYENKPKSEKVTGRPPFICLLKDAIDEVERGRYNNMPDSCKTYFEDLKSKLAEEVSKGNMNAARLLTSLRYISLHSPQTRYCLESYISKRLDILSGNMQTGSMSGGRFVKKYTRNKYRITVGSMRRAKILYRNPNTVWQQTHTENGVVVSKNYVIDCSRWER